MVLAVSAFDALDDAKVEVTAIARAAIVCLAMENVVTTFHSEG